MKRVQLGDLAEGRSRLASGGVGLEGRELFLPRKFVRPHGARFGRLARVLPSWRTYCGLHMQWQPCSVRDWHVMVVMVRFAEECSG